MNTKKPEKKIPKLKKISEADVIMHLQRNLTLGHFLETAIEPIISDSEVIACFSDIRGFTSYCRLQQQKNQDTKIHNFLKRFTRIYSEAFAIWYNDNSTNLFNPSMVAPTMYKNLGDGLMMVWEIPSELEIGEQSILTLEILGLIHYFQDRFYYHFRDLTPIERNAYSDDVTELEIGFGVAKGHAWKLDYGNTKDYAGSVINLASRLQDLARPSGIVAHYDMAPDIFDNDPPFAGKCRILKSVSGFQNIKAWMSDSVIISK
ncbi:hypothetical protein [Leptospira kanakyensis]|uniref:Guanylate cyclase domain-containing protein n=1 Tax=Leptospira kanakyensis TaxID=2484968 RepID=A0A6N4QJA2_9LEPT|nr:hypothetical protein [Leptospira kanakyensis]MCW7470990.1 hypothetical protein [Leptospira kanakyensis]MCW7483094.1 hypothetical protein [Leptospira kanakyensis]TGK48787.1 hypothetical protein EHQ11_15740 [Leptospira kanakyensis]TGK58941.1 hypothetical protein EHQ16_11310 [Leptospira kanakyensis]TGK75092.1 hypothetical protein EHQ18_01985 [Leptospira kanakyensis]